MISVVVVLVMAQRGSLGALFSLPFLGQLSLVLGLVWLDSGGLVSLGLTVGLLKPPIECSLPKILSSALPSFSTSFVHKSMSAGVAAISAISNI